jgi:MarR family transcriptional regulator, organic hydroperoxide resistance regulator
MLMHMLSTRMLHSHMMKTQTLWMARRVIFPGKELLLGINVMYQLSNSLPYLLTRLGVRMGDLFTRVIRKEKLTLPMYRVLASLSEERRPLRLGEIATLTSIDQSTLSRLVAEMERAELLTRERPQNNQRSLQVTLTSRGAELASRLMPIAAYYEEVAAETLSSKEIAALKTTLSQLYVNLDRLERKVESGEIKIPPAQWTRESPSDLPGARPKEKHRGKASNRRG